jgi:hypothetical protein
MKLQYPPRIDIQTFNLPNGPCVRTWSYKELKADERDGKQQRKFAKVVLVASEGIVVEEKLTEASLSTLTALENLPPQKKRREATRLKMVLHINMRKATWYHQQRPFLSLHSKKGSICLVGLGGIVIQMYDFNMKQWKFLVVGKLLHIKTWG